MVKRIIAVATVVILLGMYGATLICAILSTPATKNMFLGCLILTLVVPVVMWIFLALYKRAHADDDKNITMAEMRRYKKRMKNGESAEAIAKEIEEKYNIKETKEN
ncbi:MAG: hypothetical protein K6G60_00625 [Lachnospiraceae bacterium]|nr:hypothetical protein [Lachnospiraceae bacterium]